MSTVSYRNFQWTHHFPFDVANVYFFFFLFAICFDPSSRTLLVFNSDIKRKKNVFISFNYNENRQHVLTFISIPDERFVVFFFSTPQLNANPSRGKKSHAIMSICERCVSLDAENDMKNSSSVWLNRLLQCPHLHSGALVSVRISSLTNEPLTHFLAPWEPHNMLITRNSLIPFSRL